MQAIATDLPASSVGQAAVRYPAIAIIVWALALMAPAIALGHISGHSSFFNVVWSEGFASRLVAGDFYPRWLPDVSQGGGSPVFYFYGPLPFYLIAPFHLAVDPRLAVVLGSTVMLALSGLAFFQMARTFVSRWAALIAAVVYMALPYHLLADVWARTAIGEQAAFIFLPLCLFFATRLGEGAMAVAGLALSVAGLLYSHLPSTLAFAPFLSGYCVWVAVRKQSLQVLLHAGGAALLAAALAAPYVAPALTLQNMIDRNFWSVFVPSEHFLFSGDGDSFKGFIEYCFAAITVVVVLLLYQAAKAGQWSRMAPWAVMAALVVFLVTPVSSFFWNAFPILDRVQFPWRALSIFELSAAMVLAVAIDAGRAGPAVRMFGAAVAVLTAFFIFARTIAADIPPVDPHVEKQYITERADAPEYLPSCRPAAKLEGMASEATSLRRVTEALAVSSPRLLPVFYYPFLEVFVDGTSVATSCDPATGRIRVETIAASYEVRRKPLAIEYWGGAIALGGLAVVIAMTLLDRRRRGRSSL